MIERDQVGWAPVFATLDPVIAAGGMILLVGRNGDEEALFRFAPLVVRGSALLVDPMLTVNAE